MILRINRVVFERCFLVLIALLFSVDRTQAIIITADEVGSDVVFSSPGGQLDVSGLTWTGTHGNPSPIIYPADSTFLLGPPQNSASARVYSGYSGPTNIGTGGFAVTASSTTSTVFYGFRFGDLYLPSDFVSGDVLPAGSITFANSTLSSLGVARGDYTWSWGAGGSDESFNLMVVPEPSTYALIIGTACLGFVVWKRRRQSKELVD